MTNFKATFSELRDSTYQDWVSVGAPAAVSYTSYLDTWYGMSDDSALWMEAPYITTYLDNTTTPQGTCTMTPRWEWTDALGGHKYGPAAICAISRTGIVQDRRHRVQGKGRVIQMHFESIGNNPFNLLGWSIQLDRNANY